MRNEPFELVDDARASLGHPDSAGGGVIGSPASTPLSPRDAEGEILFPAVPETHGPMGPITHPCAEHEENERGRREASAPEDSSKPIALARSLPQIARRRFSKEGLVLFPMARQEMGGGEFERLGGGWSRVREIGGP